MRALVPVRLWSEVLSQAEADEIDQQWRRISPGSPLNSSYPRGRCEALTTVMMRSRCIRGRMQGDPLFCCVHRRQETKAWRVREGTAYLARMLVFAAHVRKVEAQRSRRAHQDSVAYSGA